MRHAGHAIRCRVERTAYCVALRNRLFSIKESTAMKRTGPESENPCNSQPYQNRNGQSPDSTYTGQNGGVQGNVRVGLPTIKTEPGERATSGLPSFPPPPPVAPAAPAGMYPVVPHPFPHFRSAPSATGPGMLALQPPWMLHASPPGMTMRMPPMAPPQYRLPRRTASRPRDRMAAVCQRLSTATLRYHPRRRAQQFQPARRQTYFWTRR